MAPIDAQHFCLGTSIFSGMLTPQRDVLFSDLLTACSLATAPTISFRWSSLALSMFSTFVLVQVSSLQECFHHATATFLRTTAQRVFDHDPIDDRLRRWSCHSIRVTAANLLHRACMSDSYIQTRLRWKSTTFLMYLRNTFYAADQHTAAMKISNRNLPTLTTSNGEPPWKLMKIRGRLHNFTTSILPSQT